MRSLYNKKKCITYSRANFFSFFSFALTVFQLLGEIWFPSPSPKVPGNFICQKLYSHVIKTQYSHQRRCREQEALLGFSWLFPTLPSSRHICFSAKSNHIPLIPKGNLTSETFSGIGYQGNNSNSFRFLCFYYMPSIALSTFELAFHRPIYGAGTGILSIGRPRPEAGKFFVQSYAAKKSWSQEMSPNKASTLNQGSQ